MNFCPFCGRKIEDSDTFCGFCGTPIEDPAKAAQSNSAVHLSNDVPTEVTQRVVPVAPVVHEFVDEPARPFAPAPQAAPAPQIQQQYQQLQQQPKRMSTGMLIGIVAGISVLLIGGVLATVLLVTNNSNKSSGKRSGTTKIWIEDTEAPSPTPTPEPTEAPESEPEELESEETSESSLDPNAITNSDAEKAIEKFIKLNYPDVNSYPDACYWGIDASKTNNETAVVLFRSYTGAHMTYYINRATGETYETSYLPNIDSEKPEERTGVTFNVRDYLNNSGSSSTPTPVPTSAPRQVSVTDTYYKEFIVEGESTYDRVPKIAIEGIDTSALNKDIYNTCKKHFNYMGMSYSYYVGEKYISIIISIWGNHAEEMHEIFNVSRVSGKKLTRKQMLSLLSITSKDFDSKVKKLIKKEWAWALKSGEYSKQQYNEAIGSKTLKRAIPCVNSKGKVCCYIYQLPYPGGADFIDFFKTI